MSDGVGIPPFGEHRHRRDCADRRTETAGLPHSVHHFSQQRFFTDVAEALTRVAELKLSTEPVDLVGSSSVELGGKLIAGVDRLGVDDHRHRPIEPGTVVGDVVKQRQLAVIYDGGAIGCCLFPSRHPFVDEPRDVRVRCDNDEHRWHRIRVGLLRLLPLFEVLLVVAVQRRERSFEIGW